MKDVRKIAGALVYGVLIMGLVRSAVVVLVALIALLTWVVAVPPLVLVRLLHRSNPPISPGYFVKYAIRLGDAVLSRTLVRPWEQGEFEPWPWIEGRARVERWRLRDLV